MTFADTTSLPWSLLNWSLDWDALLAQFPWLHDLAGTPQDAHYHLEGDVLTHTRMVAEALVALPAWRALDPATRAVLFTAALLHDIAKPICTAIDRQGRSSSPRHARKGEQLARRLLWRDHGQYGHIRSAARPCFAVVNGARLALECASRRRVC